MSNVYGPRQNPHGEAGVIAIFCAAAASSRPVTIFGDGTQTRDFVYVEDVVRGFAAAGRSDEQGAINLSTGVETSLLELAAALWAWRPRPGRSGSARSPARPSTRPPPFAAGLGRGDAAGRGPAAHARLDDLRKAASEGGGVVSQRSLAGASRRLRPRLSTRNAVPGDRQLRAWAGG